jgi:hypothetical protein
VNAADNVITAGALRAKGYDVPADVPDCAWVPADSLRPDVTCDPSNGTITVAITFTAPWQWYEATVTLRDP